MHNYLVKLNEIAESHGGKLLSTEYFGAIHKYWFLDEEGNKFEAWGYGIKSGTRWSPYTANKRKAKKLIQYTIDDLKKHAATKGGDCLSTEYINTKTKYHWIDNKGREFHMAWTNVLNNQWSPHEKKETLREKHLTSLETLQNLAKKYGGELLSKESHGQNHSYLWKDRMGNVFNRRYTSILRTGDLLFKTVSKFEDNIFNFLKENNIEFIKNDRHAIAPFELDFYIPSLKLAIEVNGAYYHSEANRKDKNYHINKYKKCREQGIELIQFLDKELEKQETQIKSFLKSKLLKNDIIGARECEMKEVNRIDAVEFLNKYHILGSINFIKAFGLYKDNELINMITIGNHHRVNDYEYKVLNRYVCRDGYNVCGGLSKLVNAAKSEFGGLITWIDLRWSNGDNWIKSGWTLDEILLPDFIYYNIKKKQIISRNSIQQLARKYSLTESEFATTNNLTKIYDCGKLRLKI